jgi:hypothetical protein
MSRAEWFLVMTNMKNLEKKAAKMKLSALVPVFKKP